MSAPADSDLRELERLLVRAGDSGAPLTVAGLCDELATGPADIAVMLDTLREHGKAVEDSPGEWRAPLPEDGGREMENPDGRVRVRTGQDEPDDEPEPTQGGDAPWLAADLGATVRLTAGVAAALDANALGAIVKAGITEAQENGVPFTLEVMT